MGSEPPRRELRARRGLVPVFATTPGTDTAKDCRIKRTGVEALAELIRKRAQYMRAATMPPTAPGAEAVDHEFSFSRADFDRVRQLIYQHAGISLHDGKHAMVYSRLSRRLRETGHRSFASYLQWLEGVSGPQGEQEWQEFVNCLTTNLTSFFREEHHFHALADDLKPLAGKPVRIWCCAASTGEEPDRKSTRLNSSHLKLSRMPSSA